MPATRAGTRQMRFSIPFSAFKNKILGRSFELSLVFCDPRLSRQLNRAYRGKDRATNVLAFPISRESGEIFIDLATAKREAKIFSSSFRDFVALLFIHGLLHLKGMRHGRKMERLEKQLLYDASNRSRH